MITTHNRAAEMERTCGMLRALEPAPSEILITADGCTDQTAEVVRSVVPSARLFINRESQGSVASRDRMMREARGDLVLSLDDDSYPEQPDCIARFTPLFQEDEKLAVLHFPQRSDEFPDSLTCSDFGPVRPTRSFASSGAVLRRSSYLELGGFETSFFHAYEEPDYALRCIAVGYQIVTCPKVTIRHHFSQRARNEIRTHHRQATNELWSALIRCPFPHVLGLITWRVLAQLRYAFNRGWNWVWKEPVWWWTALKGLPRYLAKRDPVSWRGYRKWLSLT